MFTKFAGGALLAGSLILGSAGVAFASTPSGATPSSTSAAAVSVNCANATKALTRIQTIEAHIDAGLPKLTAAQHAATAAGRTKRADRLEKRIARWESAAFMQRLQNRSQTIETTCNVSAPAPSGS